MDGSTFDHEGFAAHLESKQEGVKKNLTQAITNACLRIEATAKKSMAKTQRSDIGRVVTKGGKKHFPSVPGAPPAPDTGTLMRSITHKVDVTEGVVGSNIDYGRDLEYGTSRTLARPWLRPAVEAVRPSFEADLKVAVTGDEVREADENV